MFQIRSSVQLGCALVNKLVTATPLESSDKEFAAGKDSAGQMSSERGNNFFGFLDSLK